MHLRAVRDEGSGTSGRGGILGFFLVGGIGLAGVGAYLALAGGTEGAGAGVVLASIGAIWALVALAVRGVYVGMHRRAMAERELFETGRRATAIVEQVETTGMVLNNVNQQIVLGLRVQPPGEPEFTHRRRMFVPFHGMPRTGDLIEVAYDPADRSRLALATDWRSDTAGGRLLLLRRPGEPGQMSAGLQAGAAATHGGGTRADPVIEQLERLDRLRQSGTLTYTEFEEQKARILSEGRG